MNQAFKLQLNVVFSKNKSCTIHLDAFLSFGVKWKIPIDLIRRAKFTIILFYFIKVNNVI